MNKMDGISSAKEKWIRIFRWYFYIAAIQLSLYFIVPVLIFPGRLAMDIEVISALSLGVIVCVFFLLVNILGWFLDRGRRILYGSLISLMVVYFIWVIISWSFIERMDYLLR